jgi:hypothetical protein
MPWIRFAQDFNWHVPAYKGRVTIAFKNGTTKFVTRAAAAAAISAGKAEPAERPVRKER